MKKYKYAGNRSVTDGTISISLSDGRGAGVGGIIELTEEEFEKLNNSFILELIGEPKAAKSVTEDKFDAEDVNGSFIPSLKNRN